MCACLTFASLAHSMNECLDLRTYKVNANSASKEWINLRKGEPIPVKSTSKVLVLEANPENQHKSAIQTKETWTWLALETTCCDGISMYQS